MRLVPAIAVLSLWILSPDQATARMVQTSQSAMATRPPAKRGLIIRLKERWTLGRITRQVRHLSRRGKRPVVVFDLDNTLFDPTFRATQILRHIGRRNDVNVLKRFTYRGENAADLYKLVAQEVHDQGKLASMGRSFARLYDRLGATGKGDRLAPGAVAYAQALHHAGAEIVYLTGREQRYAARTQKTLRAVGLPAGSSRVNLMMRPASVHDVVAFKRSRLNAVAGLGRVVATFDDDPANCQLFRTHFPRAKTVFVQLHDGPAKPTVAGVVHLRDFSASGLR